MLTAICFQLLKETAEHFALDANMFFLLAKLTKQGDCECYLCDVFTNELQSLGLEELIKNLKSDKDCDRF